MNSSLLPDRTALCGLTPTPTPIRCSTPYIWRMYEKSMTATELWMI